MLNDHKIFKKFYDLSQESFEKKLYHSNLKSSFSNTSKYYRFNKAIIGIFNLFIIKKKLNSKNFSNIVIYSHNISKLDEYIDTNLNNSSTLLIGTNPNYAFNSYKNYKVYNIGTLIRVIAKIFQLTKFRKPQPIFIHESYIFKKIFKFFKFLDSNIYYSNLKQPAIAGLCALPFNRRNKIIEIQHGSVISSTEYETLFILDYIDIFYIDNKLTLNYLLSKKNSLTYKNKIHLKKQNINLDISTMENNILKIIYCSSVELNGFDEAFKDFLTQGFNKKKYDIYLKLHPREVSKDNFSNFLNNKGIKYKIVDNNEFHDLLKYKKIIIITPWSGIIEDIINLKIPAIISHPHGKERFSNLIDQEFAFFPTSLSEMLSIMDNI